MSRLSNLKQTLSTLLLSSSTKTDIFLSHLQRLLSTTSGIEATLCTLYYTLAFTHAQLTHLLSRKYEQLAESIAQNASTSMLPGETLVATIEAPHLTLTETCITVKSLGDAIEDVRMFTRLWGVLDVYAWAKRTRDKPPRDPAIKLLVWGRILTTVGFQVCENVAYLTRRGVVRGERWTRRESQFWVWSSRFWLAQVGLEGLRLLRVRQLRFDEEFGAEKVRAAGVEVDEKDVKIQSQELEERWWRDVYSNLGWLPTSLHWSFFDEESSPISEATIGLGGMVPGIIALRKAWSETA